MRSRKDAYQEMAEIVGSENVSEEPAVLDGYAWQPFGNANPKVWLERPVATVLPKTAEEVQGIVGVCNKFGLKFKALSTGWGAHAGPSLQDVVQIDLRRMDQIIEIDEENMYAVVEPYAICAQVQAEVMKRGLNLHIIGAGSGTSPLASCTSVAGMGWTSISTGHNNRNVLAVEWVLPSGKILRLGSLGSGCGWFCGDGPGPSLRGIMRGNLGASGGIGVFTKCAIKLYSWAGPRQPKIEGTMLDVRTEVPENFRIYLCFLPDWEAHTEAVYRIGEAEIGFMLGKNAAGLLMSVTTPRFLRKVAGLKRVRELARAFQHGFQFIISAHSRGDLDYQVRTLQAIISECGGILIDLSDSRLRGMLWWGVTRASMPPLVHRVEGSFNASMGACESPDAATLQAKLGEKIKEKWIQEGVLLDDFSDNSWTLSYENGLFAHTEELALYDHRDEKQMKGLGGYVQDILSACAANAQGPGIMGSDPFVRRMFSPLQCHYNRWTQRIKDAFDPGGAADATYYVSEDDS
jgi:glycolate oxidase